MKKKNLLLLLLLFISLLASCWLGGFLGGLIAGFLLCILIFSIAGYYLDRAADKKMAEDRASYLLKRQQYVQGTED